MNKMRMYISESRAAYEDMYHGLFSKYLFNMAIADYPKTLQTDEQRAMFVDETICDPDCCPEAALECFVAKMCLMGKPIYWERML